MLDRVRHRSKFPVSGEALVDFVFSSSRTRVKSSCMVLGGRYLVVMEISNNGHKQGIATQETYGITKEVSGVSFLHALC